MNINKLLLLAARRLSRSPKLTNFTPSVSDAKRKPARSVSAIARNVKWRAQTRWKDLERKMKLTLVFVLLCCACAVLPAAAQTAAAPQRAAATAQQTAATATGE